MTFSATAESLLPASVLQNGDFLVTEGITEPLQFAHPPYFILWEAMEKVHYSGLDVSVANVTIKMEQDETLDMLSLLEDSDIRGKDALKSLAEMPLDGANTENIAQVIQTVSAKRQIANHAQHLVEMANNPDVTPDDLLATWDVEAVKISLRAGINAKGVTTLSSATKSLKDIFIDAVENGSAYIEVGLDGWDDPVGGLYGGRVYIVAGTSGSGKSTLAQNIMFFVSLMGGIKIGVNKDKVQGKKKGGMFSLEMRAEEISARFIQMLTGIDQIKIEKGEVDPSQLKILGDAFEELIDVMEEMVFIDDTQEVTIPQLRANIRRMVAMGAEYIVVDQLDMVTLGSGLDGKSFNEGNLKTYRIKAIAREFDIPIIVCHQLNKSTDNVKRKNVLEVSLSDLANSGQNAVDAIVFCRHNEQGTINALIWEKARQGTKGTKYVDFDPVKIVYSDDPNQQDRTYSGDDEERA